MHFGGANVQTLKFEDLKGRVTRELYSHKIALLVDNMLRLHIMLLNSTSPYLIPMPKFDDPQPAAYVT